MSARQTVWTILALCLCWQATAQTEPDLEIGGYLKNFSTVFERSLPVGSTRAEHPWAISNRLRLTLAAKWPERLAWQAAYDLSPRFQHRDLADQGSAVIDLAGQGYRVADLDRQLEPDEDETSRHFVLRQNLDRLAATWSGARADVTIGRQAIAWGSAKIVNPTDVLAPYVFNELDTEERPGVDAVRLRLAIGALGEVDAGVVLGKDFDADRSAAFVRQRCYVRETDVNLMAMGFRDHLMLGFDVTRAVGGCGFWLETAYVDAGFFGGAEEARDQEYFRVSLGFDRQLTGQAYGLAEYHYNGPGKSRPADYLESLTTPAYRDAATYLLGRHYLALGLMQQATPLISLSGTVLGNAGDGSVSFSPVIEYNVAEDVYLSVGASIGLGPGPRARFGDPDLPEFRSEFGGYPNLYYVSLRYYF